jgi:hypothetical protein
MPEFLHGALERQINDEGILSCCESVGVILVAASREEHPIALSNKESHEIIELCRTLMQAIDSASRPP